MLYTSNRVIAQILMKSSSNPCLRLFHIQAVTACELLVYALSNGLDVLRKKFLLGRYVILCPADAKFKSSMN